MTPQYDVIIIGGGINGAAIASAVGARGYRTLVLEQGDFASGTTSASTKLIHGGLRYLETGDAALVHESLQSREQLLRERPHLVQPLGFLLPVYRGDPRPAAVIRSGLLLYDLLSPRKVTPWHRSFSTRQLQRREPSLSTDGLDAAYLYYDAQVTMPERLTLEYLAEARSSGADLRNYSAVDFIIVDRGRARGVDFHDVLTGRRSSAAARLVINAAGPWVDAVLEATGKDARATRRGHARITSGAQPGASRTAQRGAALGLAPMGARSSSCPGSSTTSSAPPMCTIPATRRTSAPIPGRSIT